MNNLSKSLAPDDVIILGSGSTQVGEHWNLSIKELALNAITLARSTAPDLVPDSFYVANMLAPALSGQTQLGALLADFAGLRGIEALTIEAAGASGGAALRQAYLAIKAGGARSALVVGVEKVTDRISAQLDAALATTTDADFEAAQGITPMSQAAMLMRRYMHEFGTPSDALAGFSLNSHANGATNPQAMFRKAIGIEAYQRAPMVSDPINMFDAAPFADGAAALLLVRADAFHTLSELPPVRIVASAAATAAVALHDQHDPLTLSAAKLSADKAYQLAGMKPESIDFFELHDQFTIYAALAMEAAGFASRGEGWKLGSNGSISRTGSIPICTLGGSKARGDAGGATGVIQVVEAVRQLQGLAGENQIVNAHVGMSQCLGGVGANAVTHIFEAVDG
jgi:acetyl-CoA C-acetyltransferase